LTFVKGGYGTDGIYFGQLPDLLVYCFFKAFHRFFQIFHTGSEGYPHITRRTER